MRAAFLLPLALLLAVAPSATVPAAAHGHPWAQRTAQAAAWAQTREGVVAFAVVDEAGAVHGRLLRRPFPSASVFKAVALVAYLDSPGVRGRALTAADRRLLDPMIRRSANAPAGRIRDLLGAAAIECRARLAGLEDFRVAPRWGDSPVTAADLARFVRRIDLEVPERHREYARRLLGGIVPEQRWGFAEARPPGFELLFKGGWRPTPRGRLVNQVALLQRGERRIGLAVLTDGGPEHRYGTRTVRGVARRLLVGLT